MYYKTLSLYIFFSLLLILISCQEGLAPESSKLIPTTSFIKGKIVYKGGISRFPDLSEIFGIYAAAFKQFPKDSSSVVNELISGNVFLNSSILPYPVDSCEFSIKITNCPVKLEYIVIAQQYDSSLFKAIGIFTEFNNNNKPSQLMIEGGKNYNLVINVDFDSLPPSPFK